MKDSTEQFRPFGHQSPHAPSQEESPPACIHVRLRFVQAFLFISAKCQRVVLCGRDMVNEQRQYLVNPLVLPAFRVEGPMLQGEQLQSEARTTFLCHQKQFGLTAEIISSNNAEQWI